MEMNSVPLDSDQEIIKQEGKKQKSRLQRHAPATLQLNRHQGNCSFESCVIPLLSPLTLTPPPSPALEERTNCSEKGSSGDEGATDTGNRLRFPRPGQEWWSPGSPMPIADLFPLISLAQNLQ